MSILYQNLIENKEILCNEYKIYVYEILSQQKLSVFDDEFIFKKYFGYFFFLFSF